MPEIIVETLDQVPVGQRRIELVERKGIGHPDSICDAIMEDISVALCREYLSVFGRILHFNVDKCLLVAGRTSPKLGGGKFIEPMHLIFGDRATEECGGKRLDVGNIAETTAKNWLRGHLRFVDPEKHFVFQSELREGSPELAGIFSRGTIVANDTSGAIGYAPLSETEKIVLACEQELNSPGFKQRFPEAGEDVKVMGYRRDRDLTLTVALAFLDRFVPHAARYFARKQEICAALSAVVACKQQSLDHINIAINTLDDPARGEDGLYLTVLGTSAESGDCGQVGRGNKVNGLISLNRPLGTEAAAGKNPVSHVGKIYTLLSHQLAGAIHAKVPGIREVYVSLGSQIGSPIDQPAMAGVQLVLEEGLHLAEVESTVKDVLQAGLANVDDFTQQLIQGVWPVC